MILTEDVKALKAARLTASTNWGTEKAEFSLRPQAQSKKIGTKDHLEKEVPGRPAPLIWVSLLCLICHHLHRMNLTMTLSHTLPQTMLLVTPTDTSLKYHLPSLTQLLPLDALDPSQASLGPQFHIPQ